MKKVLIFELNNYHTETFPMYRHLLPALLKDDKLEISYYALAEKMADLKESYQNVFPIAGGIGCFFASKLNMRKPFFISKINGIIEKSGADTVVFNSVEPERNLEVFHKIKAKNKIGIVHNPSKVNLEKKDNEHYFVLSRTVFEEHKDRLPIDGYMLPFFIPDNIKIPKKAHSDIIIAIQGLIKFKRRDYEFVVEVAKELKKRDIKSIKFNIIGNIDSKDGKKLLKSVSESGLDEYFIFHGLLNDTEFLEEIAKCDFVMTALGEKHKKYFMDKTTASFSHSAAFRIPMILSEENAKAWDLGEEVAIVYHSKADLIEKLLEVDRNLTKDRFSSRIDSMIQENYKLFIKD